MKLQLDRLGLALAFTAAALLGDGLANAQQSEPPIERGPIQRFNPAQDVGLDQKLGAKLPLELVFRDEAGRDVKLGDYFGKRPVILSLVYYECPMLCSEVLNEEIHVMRMMTLEPGKDFELVTVSIDPRETSELAASKKARYIAEAKKAGLEGAWHFLVGDQASIAKLASTVGFRYVYDPEQKQFAHAGGLMVVTPQGEVAKYFYGIEYIPRDVRLALVEAGEGKIGTVVDQFLMLCLHYDPVTGKYGLAIMTIIRALGVATLVALLAYVWRNARRDAKHSAALRTALADRSS